MFALCNAAVINPTFRVVVSSRLTLYIYASPLGKSNPETARVVMQTDLHRWIYYPVFTFRKDIIMMLTL